MYGTFNVYHMAEIQFLKSIFFQQIHAHVFPNS